MPINTGGREARMRPVAGAVPAIFFAPVESTGPGGAYWAALFAHLQERAALA
jgi:hypothetical protein